MNYHSIPKVKVESVGTFLPQQIVHSDDLMNEIDSANRYNIPIDWLATVMGIEQRRVAEANSKPSDLAVPAAQEALDSCKSVNPDDIGLVVFCGIERDQPEPATAHTIQNALGLSANHAFDLANACFGFIDAMEVASNYIKCGIVKAALVVTGEVPSRVMHAAVKKLKSGVDIGTARKIIGALSVGDAGGAVVLNASNPYEMSGFELFNSLSCSSLVEQCTYQQDDSGEIDGHMDMGRITGAYLRFSNQLITETLEKLGWDHFDWVLTHQIGKKPFERLTSIAGVESKKMVKTFHKLGNITSATFPVNFKKLTQEYGVSYGDHVGGCFAGSGLAVGQFGYTF